MLQFNRYQVGAIIALLLMAAYFALPNFLPHDEETGERLVPGFLDTEVTLGLDLQGGSYLLLEVNTDQVLVDRVVSQQSDLRNTLRRADGGRILFGNLTVDRESLSVTVPISNAEDMDRAFAELRQYTRPSGGVGGFGGTALRAWDLSRNNASQSLTLTMTEDARLFFGNTAVTDSIEAIRRRIDAAGTTEPSIQRQGFNRLVLQVPGDENSDRLQSLINQEGRLTYHLVDEAADPNAPIPPRRILVPYPDFNTSLVLMEDALITGDMVETASHSPDPDSAFFQVNFDFDNRGARRFREATTENVGRRFAVVLDNEIITAPNIIQPILGGSGRITGNFTPEEAAETAILIRAGALPAELTIIEQRTVGAGLGADSVRAGTIALIIGFIGVVIYILITYGRFGLYADMALLANVVLIAGALSMLQSTLTLPGIAGIVLTIGMAVDANVLIFERIREELDAGKSPVNAVESGYKNAWSAIFDANLTTLIAAMIMFQLGSGPVQGFAVTLGIGVITSVFTAFVITRFFAGRHVLGNRSKTLTV